MLWSLVVGAVAQNEPHQEPARHGQKHSENNKAQWEPSWHSILHPCSSLCFTDPKPPRAAGGLEAERAERQRCKEEVAAADRRNFEFMQELRRAGYRKVGVVQWPCMLAHEARVGWEACSVWVHLGQVSKQRGGKGDRRKGRQPALAHHAPSPMHPLTPPPSCCPSPNPSANTAAAAP